MSVEQSAGAKLGTHNWISKDGYKWQFCEICGIVRRADDKNAPCKGPTKMREPEKPVAESSPTDISNLCRDSFHKCCAITVHGASCGCECHRQSSPVPQEEATPALGNPLVAHDAREKFAVLLDNLELMMHELNGGEFESTYTHVILPQLLRYQGQLEVTEAGVKRTPRGSKTK